MLKRFQLLLLLSISTLGLQAQTLAPSNSIEIYKKLQTFNTLPRILYMAAHPDDENTGLLSFLTQHAHIRTAYLSLTRGDGGQNLLGSEQGAALGLIRTYELLEARKLDGAEQYFTRAIDFGYSKNPEDTFKQWDIDSITADAVWVIRKFRPDVIICRFPPTAAAGHGQHSASAIIAERAFKAAGDPEQFPEQLVYVDPFQPKSLLWNTFRFDGNNTTSAAQFHIQAGQFDPLLGLGYGELAGISRSLHKSQGAGTPSIAGINTEYFETVQGTAPEHTLWDGLALTWADTEHKVFAKKLSHIIDTYDFNAPSKSIPELIELRKILSSWEGSDLKKEKLAALDALILNCSGLLVELVTSNPEALAGESLPFTLQMVSRSDTPVTVRTIHWLDTQEQAQLQLQQDVLTKLEKQIHIPENNLENSPYWMRLPPQNPGLYTVSSDTLIGRPDYSDLPKIGIDLEIQNEVFHLSVPLSYKYLDPIKGDVVEPLRIVPEIEIRLNQKLFLAQAHAGINIPVQLKSRIPVQGELLLLHAGEVVKSKKLTLDHAGNHQQVMHLNAEELIRIGDGDIQVHFLSGQKQFYKAQELIRYPHLPTLQYFNDAQAKIIHVDIQNLPKKVGYIPGAGDYIPEFMELAGIDVHLLSPEELSDTDRLLDLDAIVTGVRIANISSDIGSWIPHLLKYVHQGGTLLMQYNTASRLMTKALGPYPFTLSQQRVSEENAPITILDTSARLLKYPFEIKDRDFQNWVQERGLYFASEWDNRYKTLFSMQDTGEETQEGSVLYTPYGQGMYIYTGLSFFRQLPAGNPGAIKLFFNLLAATQDEQ